jgi:hypothetical protein
MSNGIIDEIDRTENVRFIVEAANEMGKALRGICSQVVDVIDSPIVPKAIDEP